MKTTILTFHPHLNDQSNVTKAFYDGLEQRGYEIRDMYSLYPDFKIDYLSEQKVLEKADRIVLLFPTYWYSTPALLKQWEDDVWTYGWAYGSEGKALQGKELLIVTSTGSSAYDYSKEGTYGYTIEELFRPLENSCVFTGMKYLKPFATYGAMGIEKDALDERIRELIELLEK